MTLIKSISGTRGTIGGKIGEGLTPVDIILSSAAFGQWLINSGQERRVVLGRDGRITGQSISHLVAQTLIMQGIDVVDLGLSTTPTVEIAVPIENAGGGIILTASHNPKHWNALKFVNHKGEFISASDGQELLSLIEQRSIEFADVDNQGKYSTDDSYIDKHIELICALPYVSVESIKAANFHLVIDVINSTGAIAIPALLDRLGCTYSIINGDITGEFAHNPEPLPEHLTQLSSEVIREKADMGVSVDPDVDRLALVCEDGSMFGEEYTLVAAADFVLGKKIGNTVSNLSSTRALQDITLDKGGQYYASAVGEVNVVNKMKACNAVIGGEGNGGVILPDLHYGRDALVGLALILNHLADRKLTLSALKKTYPEYIISKNKIDLAPDTDVDSILDSVVSHFSHEKIDLQDGVKIDFSDGWVQLRKSNTEPILRVYAEAKDYKRASELAEKVIKIVQFN